MADLRTAATTGPGSGGGRVYYGWWIVTALAITQTAGYGVLYYAFAVLLTPMQRDLDASGTAITGALTLSLLVAAVTAVPVGWWLDRRGGRGLMVGGAALGTLMVAAWSQVHSLLTLYLVFAGIGLASAMVLYEPAFAVIVTWFQDRRATALLAVTVVAGFASTIFMPLTGQLTEAYGWRTTLLVLAATYGLLCIPLHLVIRNPPTSRTSSAALTSERTQLTRAALHDPAFWALTLAFVAHMAAVAVIGVHLVAYLLDLGHSITFAATITGLLGVLSVTGRLVTTAAQRQRAPTTVVATVFLLQALGALAFPLVGRAALAAIACVLALGLGFGVATIARPALIADRYGTLAYATLSGLMTFPLILTKAIAPLAAAWLQATTHSYTPVMLTVAGACALAAVTLLLSTRIHSRTFHSAD